jgi:hypothetical protein
MAGKLVLYSPAHQIQEAILIFVIAATASRTLVRANRAVLHFAVTNGFCSVIGAKYDHVAWRADDDPHPKLRSITCVFERCCTYSTLRGFSGGSASVFGCIPDHARQPA